MIDKTSLALARFGLGAAPGEIENAGQDPVGYLLQPLGDKGSYQLGHFKLAGTAENAASMFAARKMLDAGDKQKAKKPGPVAQQIYLKELDARFKTYAETTAPFAERLALFWSNHFAVSARQQAVKSVAGSYEREAIRPHINGRFEEMLLAVEQHPAMLAFLDNAQSTGPNSKAGQKQNRGLNENLAREILELHTYGVNGGYSQADIVELAKAITGWSFGTDDGKGKTGVFEFRANAHEPGDRIVLGKTYANAKGAAQGKAILTDLAHALPTALHVCRRLAGYFISDAPSAGLVAAMAKTFMATNGFLPDVYKTMLTHKDAFQTAQLKFKTPQHFLASVIRLTRPDNKSEVLRNGMERMGQVLWAPSSPKGWDQDAATWATGSGLKTRTEFVITIANMAQLPLSPLQLAENALGQNLTDDTATAIKRAADAKQALAILLMSPEFQRC